MHCRINQRRIWSHRIMLESNCHAETVFATLTYSNENLPAGNTLIPKHATLFLKRLRSIIGSFRYFLVGEYGDLTARAHYHVMLFGVSVAHADKIHRAWGYGNIHIGICTPDSATYIAGYCTKKLNKSHPELKGRHPEFARMSLKPGIGANAMIQLGDAMTRNKWGAKALNEYGDANDVINYDHKTALPLGRYLKGKLRDAVGMDPNIETPRFKKYQAEMQTMHSHYGEAAFKAQTPFIDHNRMDRNERKRNLKQRKL